MSALFLSLLVWIIASGCGPDLHPSEQAAVDFYEAVYVDYDKEAAQEMANDSKTVSTLVKEADEAETKELDESDILIRNNSRPPGIPAGGWGDVFL
jgi:hypothetical protein